MVRVTAFGEIAEDIAELFDLPHSFKSSAQLNEEYKLFVDVDSGFGPKFVFVRSADAQLAGTEASGPASIPSSSSFVYRGQRWNVFSFAPEPPTRIYLLFPAPAADPSGPSGASVATKSPLAGAKRR
jgi:hypothetical protein